MQITQSQIDVFEQIHLARFESSALQHVKECFAEECQRIGDELVLEIIRYGKEQARQYGFTLHKSVFIYITLMFWLGSGFDEDPIYPWAYHILNHATIADQLTKASTLEQRAMTYLNHAEGYNNQYLDGALARIVHRSLEQLLPPCEANFENYMLDRLQYIHPQKCKVVGEAHLRNLIKEGTICAEKYRFTLDQARGLYIGLMFMLGARFDSDLSLPWAKRILNSANDQEPQRLDELFRAALVHLRSGLRLRQDA